MESETRYELLESLGSGDFATVYRARDTELNREVAIRQIHSRWLAEPKFLDRYWAEAQLLASVQHPHIVTIYDIVRSRGWLILELMQANLRDRMAGRPMDLRALRTTLIHALKALKYLHSRGIIHGDINPGSLLVDQRKRVKVGDFGIARRLARTDGSVSRGTAKYMAPEALSGEISQVGPTSDLYSLGFSCYELMCGALFQDLFPGLNADGPQADATWMMWHAAPDRHLPPISQVLEGVPADLAAVIEKLIQKNPQDRFQSADEALSALGDDARGGDRDPITETAPSATASNKPRGWVIAMFAISCVASLSMLLIPSGAPKPPDRAPEAKHGIVRAADAGRSVLTFEDPLTGVPEEYPLTSKPKIRLLELGQPERYILPREIQSGDWLEVRPAAKADDEPLLIVSRPHRQSGQITRVEAPSGTLVVAIESGRLRDDVLMHVPERTVVTLNGEVSALDQARAGDRVEVVHLLDPTGKQGNLVSQLDLLRLIETMGYLDAVEPDGKSLIVADAAGKKGNRKVVITDDTAIRLMTGQAIKPADLMPGDRLAIVADASARQIIVTRTDVKDQGVFLEAREDGTCLFRSDSGNEVLVMVSHDTDIRLGNTKASLSDLRPQADRVQVTIHTSESGVKAATSIDAVRATKHDRWAFVIGNGAYEDRKIPSLPSAVADAESFRNTLVQRYAVDPEWTALLVDQDAATVRDEISRNLGKVKQPVQLVVAVFGNAYLGADGKAYLAFRDFQMARMAGTGLPLESLIDALERCPAEDKLLLLDVAHEGEAAATVDLPKLLASMKTPIRSLRIIGASAEGEFGLTTDEGRRGWFGEQLDRAFGGRADVDANLRITATELMTVLDAAATDSSHVVPQHPFLWEIDSAVEPTPAP